MDWSNTDCAVGTQKEIQPKYQKCLAFCKKNLTIACIYDIAV